MKHKQQTAAIVILAGLFLIGLCVSATSGQNAQWKGKIETVDGVKVVRNPNEPLYGDIKLELEEDLKIGRADDENYLFYRVRGLDVDIEGNIYVADMSNFRIQKFDKTGKYLLTIGRKGQGPGEFDQPTTVHIDEKTANILVQDQSYTIEIFAPDGKPIRSMRLESVFRDFRIALDGTIVGVLQAGSVTSSIQRLTKISPEGKAAQIYIEVPYTISIVKRGEITLTASTGEEFSIQFNFMSGGSIVCGYSKEYELTIMDLAGKALYRFTKNESAPRFTAKEKTRFKEISLPEFKPYFYALFADDLGRIYVQRNKTRAEEGNFQKEIDVFSRDGYFLYRTKLPKYTHVIKNGYIYALEVNDDEIVKRYKIKNWGTFKSGL